MEKGQNEREIFKMKKKFLVLVLLLMCVFVLTACFGEDVMFECPRNYDNIESTDEGEQNSPSEPEHIHTEVKIPAVEATCTTSGLTAGKKCSECDEIIVEQNKVSSKEHTYSVFWTVDVQPTCTEKGSKSKHCSVCGDKSQVTEVSALGHSWDNGEITTTPTCTGTGVKTFTCSVCSETKTKVINAKGHSWDKGETTTQPTCIGTGVKTFTCSVCSKTKTEVVNAKGHNYSTEWTVDVQPTCTEKGSKSKHCSVCADKSQITEVSANHSWNSGEITTASTCIRNGVKTFTCESCYKTKTETLSTVSHSYSTEWTIDIEATCLQFGSKSRHCLYCDDAKGYITTIPKTSHSYINGKCKYCSVSDPNYVKTYGIGDKWIVSGQWEFTVNNVTMHRCYDGKLNGEMVIIIDYSYKNIGYNSEYHYGLYFGDYGWSVADETGEIAEWQLWDCDHKGKSPSYIGIGMSCSNVQMAYVIKNRSDKITLVVSKNDSTNSTKQEAVFELNVS